KLFDWTPIHDGMAKSHVKAEVILHLPDRANQAGDRSRLTDLLFVEEFGDRPYLPLGGPLDDAAYKEIGMLIARQFSNDVGVYGSPVPALRNDSTEARAETTVGAHAPQQRPEFDRDARSAGILEAALPQHVLEKCPDAVDAGAFVGIGQRELSLALKHEFPIF